MLAHFLHSHLKVQASWPEVYQYIDGVLASDKDTVKQKFDQASEKMTKREILESKFSKGVYCHSQEGFTDVASELAVIQLTRNDFDGAQHYVTRCHQQFLDGWRTMHPLAYAARHQKLQPLQQASLFH